MLSINNTTEGYLKNVEIKGNTIQDSLGVGNLADIKSVGDKVEGQDLYEIPLLSTGKNLFDETKIVEGMLNSSNGQLVPESKYQSSEFVSVQNGVYALSCKSVKVDMVFLYDGKKEFIRKINTPTSQNILNIEDGIKYMRFRWIKDTFIQNDIQLEEGTQATQYEPYQEHKLTILSPCQIEKVGDVADRIVERDGVWGVEKNLVNYVVNGSESNISYESQLKRARIMLPNLTSKPMRSGISNRFKYDGDSHKDGGLLVHVGGVFFYNYSWTGTTSVREWLKNNNTRLIAEADNPQFIPLPHAQQIKLRTFANRTNISFLCEIEGTIKADVPKSLGATVNTHTTQIDSLNQELDRVKKLEESTVSTVVTESDFTVVEQTTQGYFEDIELKGRTLVNIKPSNLSGNYNVTVDFQTVSQLTNAKYEQVEVGKTYTAITNLDISKFNMAIYNNDGTNVVVSYQSSNIIKFIVPVGTLNIRVYIQSRIASIGTTKIKYMLLEGDHTQNPPPYFEGLASVGDGTDEIVALSINNGNLINYENFTNGKWLNPDNGDITDNSTRCVNENYIPMVSATLFFSQSQPLEQLVIHCYDINKKWIGAVGSGKILNTKMTLLHGTYYVRYAYAMTNDVLKTNSVKLGLSVSVVDIAKADKKKLLYFDPVDSTWKKPVLDEFSTIKKGSDGVYRYYKRGDKDVFNGSESWSLGGWNTANMRQFVLEPNPLICKGDLFICDRLKSILSKPSYGDEDVNCISLSSARLSVLMDKSKLTTQDVAGFKAWLQANPVTVVYQLATEQVYECTNIDLITYPGETNFMVKSGVLNPKTTLKVHSNISNVVSLLQKKVSLLESNMSKYMITQNKLMLASTYSADSVTFKVDYASMSDNKSVDSYDEDLYNLILHNILTGKDNYDYDKMFNIVMDYASWKQITWDQFDVLVGIMDLQYYPPVVEPPTEEIPPVEVKVKKVRNKKASTK